MRTFLTLIAVVALLCPSTVHAQDGKVTLDAVAKAMGAGDVKSIEFSATGLIYAPGQSTVPGQPWPQFNLKSFTRAVNYETASLRDDATRQRADTRPRGGGLPAIGEMRQLQHVSGDRAWNVTGQNVAPTPVALAERQFQLWSTPHGVIKAAQAHNGKVQGRTISFTLPNRIAVKATVNAENLIERVEAKVPSTVLGDMPVEITYLEYRDHGGVKFPTQIRQRAGGFPALDITVTEVKPNAAVDIAVPDAIKQAANPYANVKTEKVAEGVWYVTGGSHHSVVIEMKDHGILVESPLNDDRAGAVLAEAKNLLGVKPLRYVVVSHHHFDHSGGVRAAAAEGATVVVQESSRAFFERALAAKATVQPDALTRSGKKPKVEAVRDKRVLTDGSRTVEIHHVVANLHADDLVMVHLPKEKILIQADMYTPLAPTAPPPTTINPNTVNLADSVKRAGFSVEHHLPLHGRIVTHLDFLKAAGQQ